jgi:hypothetical protein
VASRSKNAAAKSKRKTSEGLTNEEVVTLAVYLLGGATRSIDTEDIAIHADSLVPGKYTWAKYPDQVNLENIRVFLTHCKSSTFGAYLTGTGKTGWRLTAAGRRFAERNADRITNEAELRPLRAAGIARRGRERSRILRLAAIQKVVGGNGDAVTRREAEAVFRVNGYVDQPERLKKIDEILRIVGSDPEIGAAIRALAARVRQGG